MFPCERASCMVRSNPPRRPSLLALAGLFYREAIMSKRLVVFIDSQNVYMRARAIFDLENADHPVGQINPLQVGNLLANRLGSEYELQQVRIYRGLPSNKFDPKGYGSVRR
jgi:hypothetical protein